MLFHKRNKDLRLLLAMITGFLLLASCETGEPECYVPVNVQALCNFQLRDTNIVDIPVGSDSNITIKDTLYVFRDSIMTSPVMTVIGEDSLITVTGIELSNLGIPFNPSKDSIRYSFKTNTADTIADTITFHYTPSVHFVSNNCGYTYYFSIDTVITTKNLLDSVSMLNRNITNDVTSRNVQFYFKKQF